MCVAAKELALVDTTLASIHFASRTPTQRDQKWAGANCPTLGRLLFDAQAHDVVIIFIVYIEIQ